MQHTGAEGLRPGKKNRTSSTSRSEQHSEAVVLLQKESEVREPIGRWEEQGLMPKLLTYEPRVCNTRSNHRSYMGKIDAAR